MNIQLKQQLKSTLLQNIDGLMREYDISALFMEDALESVLLQIKDLVMQDYIQENLEKMKDLERRLAEFQNPKEEDSE